MDNSTIERSTRPMLKIQNSNIGQSN